MKTHYLLTGDIGGTNSRLGLYDLSSSIPLCVKIYQNEEELKEGASNGIFEKKIIVPFLNLCWETVPGLAPVELAEIVACLACAGPVKDNRCIMSNRDNIVVDGDTIVKQTYVKDKYLSAIKVCKVINDFLAQGYGCLTLEPNEVRELMPDSHSKIDPSGPKVCVGAGTGLGQCYLTVGPDGNYACYPSEGGHVEFSPRTEVQVKMLKYLMEKFESRHRVSVERVVSGPGLANVYEFLANEYPEQVDPKVHEAFLNAEDQKGKVVSENAKEGTLCREAIRIMISAYGSEVGSSSIKFLPTGGMFVTGGVTPKNIHFIEGENSCFMTAYKDKGRVTPLLEKIPLFAVMTEDLGVRGALKVAFMEYEKLHAIEEAHSPNGKKTKVANDPVYGPLTLVVATVFGMAAGALVSSRITKSA
jgi:glucokinase